MWWIYAVLSAVCASLVAIFAKAGMKNIDPDLATAIRTVVILCIAWGIVIVRGLHNGIATLTTRNWMFLALSGCATGLSWLFYFRAIAVGQVSKVAPVDKLSVVFTIALSMIVFRERITWQEACGAILITIGALLMIWK